MLPNHDPKKKESSYGKLSHSPEFYDRLLQVESSRDPAYFSNTFQNSAQTAGPLQMRRGAFDDMKQWGYYKDLKYEDLTPQLAHAGSMIYATKMQDHYGLKGDNWSMLGYNQGPTKIKKLYDKHNGDLRAALNDPEMPEGGLNYIRKALMTKIGDYGKKSSTLDYTKALYNGVIKGEDINSIDPNKFIVKQQKGGETPDPAPKNGTNWLTMPGMTKYTAGYAPLVQAGANAVGLNANDKSDVFGGAGMGALAGFLSGGPLGALLGGGSALLNYGSKLGAKQNMEDEAEKSYLASRTIPGRTGMEAPTMYAALGMEVGDPKKYIPINPDPRTYEPPGLPPLHDIKQREYFPVNDVREKFLMDREIKAYEDVEGKYKKDNFGQAPQAPWNLNSNGEIQFQVPTNAAEEIRTSSPGPELDTRIRRMPTFEEAEAERKAINNQINSVIPDKFLPEVPKVRYGGVPMNTTGYLDGASTAMNPMNMIPGGNITMEGVKQALMAYPMKGGNIMGSKEMLPGENYNFKGADSVLEVPKAQVGYEVKRDTIRPDVTNQYLFNQYKKNGQAPDYIVHESGNAPARELSTFEKGLQTVDNVLSAPSRYTTQAITGKYQDPSKAWGYKDPQGFWQNAANMGIDIVADPVNLLGAGVVENIVTKVVPKLTKIGKATEVSNNVGDIIIKADRNLARKYMSDPKNLKDFYYGKLDNKFNDFVNVAYKEFPEIKTVVEKSLKLNKPEAAVALINDAIKIKENGDNYNKNTPYYSNANASGPYANKASTPLPKSKNSATFSSYVKKKAVATKSNTNTLMPKEIEQTAITPLSNSRIPISQYNKRVNGEYVSITKDEYEEIIRKGKVFSKKGIQLDSTKTRIYEKKALGGYIQGNKYTMSDRDIKKLQSLGYEIEVH